MEPNLWLEPVFEERREAEFFIEWMKEYIRTHGLITIKRIYEATGFAIWDEGRLWGWTDISSVYIEYNKECRGFKLKFPKPKKFKEIKLKQTK